VWNNFLTLLSDVRFDDWVAVCLNCVIICLILGIILILQARAATGQFNE
jgi:hypothetical protein